jgi:hypothetical protein
MEETMTAPRAALAALLEPLANRAKRLRADPLNRFDEWGDEAQLGGPLTAKEVRAVETVYDALASAAGEAAAPSADRVLEKVVAVMRMRGEPDDFLLSEIQDYLTMGGYDVPLRSYRGTPALPRAPSAPPCSVCAGQPLASGRTCICGGRRTESAEAQGLRERLADLEIALGFYPNIPRTASKAYQEVVGAVPPGAGPWEVKLHWTGDCSHHKSSDCCEHPDSCHPPLDGYSVHHPSGRFIAALFQAEAAEVCAALNRLAARPAGTEPT